VTALAVSCDVTSLKWSNVVHLKQVDGSVFVVYNTGLMDHRVGKVEPKVNDNLFHVLRLVRSGSNASLELDDRPIDEKYPTGQSGLYLDNLLHC